MTDHAPGRRSPLHDLHAELGARFTSFAGWEMPLQYANGTVSECRAVRERAGVFDVSHLARVRLRGSDAGPALRSVTTYDVTALKPGRAHYSLYCNDDGGIEDDVFVYRLPDKRWLVVHNAANAAPDFARLEAVSGSDPDDVTASTVMLAVQGPGALETLEGIFAAPLAGTRRNACLELDWAGARALFARTGYTGEDGGECVLAPEPGARLLRALIERGVDPAGLAARDTLRLEAALPLHGNDIGPDTNPFEAGLGFAVSLEDTGFTGRDALIALAANPPKRQLACVRTEERAVLRAGYELVERNAGGRTLGQLTSGGFSPTLGVGIGMAYLSAALAEPGRELAVRIRSRDVAAAVVRRPFYRRR